MPQMPARCSGSTATIPDARAESTGARTKAAAVYVIGGDQHDRKRSVSTQPAGRGACRTAANGGDESVAGAGRPTVGTHATPTVPDSRLGTAPAELPASTTRSRASAHTSTGLDIAR